MQNLILVLALALVTTGLYVAIITLPRWFVRGMDHHRMWALRDDVIDDIIAERLPRDHPAVRQLVQRMELVLRDGKHITLLDVQIFARLLGRLEPPLQRAIKKQGQMCSLKGLSDSERKLVEEYRQRFLLVVAGSMLLSSWFGLAQVMRFIPGALIRRIRASERHLLTLEVDFRSTAREATDKAVVETHVGKRVSASWPALCERDLAAPHYAA